MSLVFSWKCCEIIPCKFLQNISVWLPYCYVWTNFEVFIFKFEHDLSGWRRGCVNLIKTDLPTKVCKVQGVSRLLFFLFMKIYVSFHYSSFPNIIPVIQLPNLTQNLASILLFLVFLTQLWMQVYQNQQDV